MVVLNILISVCHDEPEFFDDWSAIHLIARLLFNWIAISMYTKMEYCFKSPLKNISNGLNEIKKIRKNGPTSLKVYKHDNSYVRPCGGPSVAMYTHHRRVSRHDKVLVFKKVFIDVFFHLWIYIVVYILE